LLIVNKFYSQIYSQITIYLIVINYCLINNNNTNCKVIVQLT